MTDLPPISLHCAFEQGRRLADLRAALDRASTLTVMLCDYCDGGHEAKVLRAQINALGAEVQAIQRGGGRRRKTGRYWINLPAS